MSANSHFPPFAPFLQLMPAMAISTPLAEVIQLLEQHFGTALYPAFDPDIDIPGPNSTGKDTHWLKSANTVGINVRTIQHFWRIVPYALTFPCAQQTIHILPIWEPGVVASLYGPSSWNINPEFFSPELAQAFPHLDTVEKQLKVVVNVLHLLGKSVGMDVVPHTDRYSEMSVGNPQLFEWLQRRDLVITDHRAALFQDVQATIFAFAQQRGSAVPGLYFPDSPRVFFHEMPESTRLQLLFGDKYDYTGRLHRRKELVQLLYDAGYETAPATMGPPYRGIEVDPDPTALVTDEEGRVWRDYRITAPEPFSRVFGPLARYKLYESKDDNRNWELDFDQPCHATWTYVCAHYRQIQAEFGFDFMRGDMSHVQMRAEGVPQQPDPYYDLLGAVKQAILPEKPYFGYFAESFLAPPGEMAYGDECDHLEASLADSTLGDLQSEPIETDEFMRQFAEYRHWLDTRQFAPNFTIMTADKDDPRFDGFYRTGNQIRYFLALFLTDMPSYMALGFECRDPHPIPAPNEQYTKLYVFALTEGAKSTTGPYQWGHNDALYADLVRQKQLAEMIFAEIEDRPLHWLLPPDKTGRHKIIAWTQAAHPAFVFVANLGAEQPESVAELSLPEGVWTCFFATDVATPAEFSVEKTLDVTQLAPGAGWVLRKK